MKTVMAAARFAGWIVMGALWMGALWMGAAGCQTGSDGYPGDEAVRGQLRAEGGAMNGWTLSPTLCRSGDHEGFYGVDFFEEPDGSGPLRWARIARLPTTETILVVSAPDSEEVIVYEACAVLDATLTHTPYWVQGVRGMTGRVRIECPGEEPDVFLRGELEFDGCY